LISINIPLRENASSPLTAGGKALMVARILVLDDRPDVADLVAAVLARYDVRRETDSALAVALLDHSEPFDAVITDARMPGVDGFEVLRAAKRASAATEVIMMTGFASIADAVQAVRQGAYDYLEKPFEPDDVLLAVARALEHRRLALEHPAQQRGSAPRDWPLAAPDVSLPYRAAVEAARDHASRDYLEGLLREFGGCVTRAATRAGMERESLHRLMRRHRIQSEAFRPLAACHPREESAGA
jgi:DNA-binding NtrC family response regulator